MSTQKTPANELNRFIERLAIFINNNKPSYVDRHNVSVSTYNKGDGINSDTHVIRFTCNFELSASKLNKIEGAGLIEEV